jgi:hypothetical protein
MGGNKNKKQEEETFQLSKVSRQALLSLSLANIVDFEQRLRRAS